MKKVIGIMMLILLLMLASGCSGSTDKKISTEPKPESIKGHYNF